MNPLLDTLCNQLAVWKSGHLPASDGTGLTTGFPALDAVLPDSGWPAAALMELLADPVGIGEMSLVLPALARLSASKGTVLIGAPFTPYAPGLAEAQVDLRRLLVIPQCPSRDALACAELALRSGACGAVVIWEANLFKLPTQSLSYLALKRLHLAAGRGNAMAVLFRSLSHAVQPSPAVLRIKLEQDADRLRLALFKRRRMFGEQTLQLNVRPERLQQEIMHPPMQPARPALPSNRFAGAASHSNALSTLAN